MLRLRIQPGVWCRWGQLFQPLLRRLHQRGRWQLHGLQLHRRRDRDSGKIFFQIFVESKFLKLLPIYARCTRHIFQRFDSFYTEQVGFHKEAIQNLNLQSAVKDHCGNKCALMYGLFITVSANIFCTFMTSMPNVIATLRAVEPVHRSLALGVESIVFRCGRKSK